MHDLLRDLCLREGEKDKFLCVFGVQSIPQGLSCQRRIATSFSREYPPTPLLESLAPAASPLRSLIGKFHETMSISSFKMLRVGLVLNSIFTEEENSCEEIVWLVNLRLLVDFKERPLYKNPSLVSFLWNLQTLCLDSIGDDYILEILEMPLLRHLIIYKGTLDGAYCLPDHPLSGDRDGVMVMKNLQTLYVVRNLKFGERFINRIPNIKMLKLEYAERGEELGDFCLNNLHRLHKLQVLHVVVGLFDFQLMRELSLPHSLKKLTLKGTKLPWDMNTKIGSLPLLQVLELHQDSFTGSEWETFEGQFSVLKFLLIDNCTDLDYWITDSAHFPRFEHLVLSHLQRLKEIPLSIGDIPTLQSITLEDCIESLVESAQRIVEEQEELGNQDL